MKEKILATVGSVLVFLMCALALFSQNQILPAIHAYFVIAASILWFVAGMRLSPKVLRVINISFALVIVVFSLIEFVIPSFGVYYIGTGIWIYSIHHYLSLGFGLLVLAFSIPAKVKISSYSIVLLCLVAFCSCGSIKFALEYPDFSRSSQPKASLDTEFAVLSDIHVYDTSLGSSGSAFEEYLKNDRKDLVSSIDLFGQALNSIQTGNSQFVIISGDLTKDGELASHLLVQKRLVEFEKNTGKKVYVIPGNHDVNNPDAMKFSGNSKTPVDTVSEADFVRIYSDFGYKKAVSRDSASLSYVAEPVQGLLFLMIDSTDTRDNFRKGFPEVGGRLDQERFSWIEKTLVQADRDGKTVMAAVHHGVIEHYTYQKKYFADYIIDENEQIVALLARFGVRVVFTGHYHATDITSNIFDGQKLYDIETGSLVTWPNAFRTVTIRDSKMTVSTNWVKSLPGRPGYASESREMTTDGIKTLAKNALDGVSLLGLKMTGDEVETISSQTAQSFLQHYKGDEEKTTKPKILYKGLSLVGKAVVGRKGQLLVSLWNDLEPKDVNLKIDLSTGDVVE